MDTIDLLELEIETAIAEAEAVIAAFTRLREKAKGRVCPECGTRFHPAHAAAVTCSDACRQRRAYRTRRGIPPESRTVADTLARLRRKSRRARR